METDVADVRVDLMHLVPLVAVEANRITAAYASHRKLHATDVEALAILRSAKQRGISVLAGELGVQLGLTSGAATFVVNRLERAGLVERKRGPLDHRKVLLNLSDAGVSVANELVGPIERLSTGVMDQYSQEELELVQRFLSATTGAMAAYRATLVKQP